MSPSHISDMSPSHISDMACCWCGSRKGYGREQLCWSCLNECLDSKICDCPYCKITYTPQKPKTWAQLVATS